MSDYTNFWLAKAFVDSGIVGVFCVVALLLLALLWAAAKLEEWFK